jgi:hypothetical protein
MEVQGCVHQNLAYLDRIAVGTSRPLMRNDISDTCMVINRICRSTKESVRGGVNVADRC